MHKIKVGVVGCGYWGPNLIRNFRASPDCEMAVISDKSKSRLDHLSSLYPEIATCRKFEDLLKHPDLDAVVIATPVDTHHSLGMRALEAGKHVFIEKPMASSSIQAEELVQRAKEKGLVLMTGHTFLYSAPVRKIKEIVDSNDIGEIRYISSRRLNLGLYQKDINVAWDLAPHDISIINYIFGEVPTSVNCQGDCNVTPGIEDITTMSLTYPGQHFALIQSSWLDPRKVREMTIVGTRRMIVYDDLEPLQKIRIFDARVERPPHYDTFAEFQYSYHYGDMYAPHIDQTEPLKEETQHFLDCINNVATPISDGQAGLDLVRILEASSESLRRKGAAVNLDELPTNPAMPKDTSVLQKTS